MNVWGSVGLVIALIALVIVLSVGATILSEIQGTQTTDSTAYNITGEGLTGAESFSNLTPVMWLVGAAAVILSLLIGGLAVRAFR